MSQRMKERLQLPYTSNLHENSPCEQVSDFSWYVHAGSRSHVVLGRLRNYPDFFASFTRLILSFVKKIMWLFRHCLWASAICIFQSTDNKVLQTVLDIETNDIANILSDPDATSGTGNIRRSCDDTEATAPPLKRSRPDDYVLD